MQIFAQEDQTTQVTATTGRHLTVCLTDSPGTGYQWQLPQVPSGLVLLSDAFDDSQTDAPGGAVIHRFEFDVQKTGLYQLAFEWSRPWESFPPEKRAQVIVEAR